VPVVVLGALAWSLEDQSMAHRLLVYHLALAATAQG
jgi:hypothetical protein